MVSSGERARSRDPRDVLRETPLPCDPGHDPQSDALIEELLGEIQDWMRRRIRKRARQTGLDPDDLHQEVRLSLLRRSAVIEPRNPGVKSWLSVRIEWTIVDVVRRRGLERPCAPELLDAAVRDKRDPCPTAEEQAAQYRFDVARLVKMGLPPRQAEVVALRCHGDDLPLKEFARLVRRSHAAVRQDLHRGLRRIENLFDLTVRESEVVRAFRRHGTATAAAPRLGLAPAEFNRILEDAHKKIDQVFSEREGRL